MSAYDLSCYKQMLVKLSEPSIEEEERTPKFWLAQPVW